MPTPRRPGDPHGPGRGPGPATLVALASFVVAMTAGARPVAAAPAAAAPTPWPPADVDKTYTYVGVIRAPAGATPSATSPGPTATSPTTAPTSPAPAGPTPSTSSPVPDPAPAPGPATSDPAPASPPATNTSDVTPGAAAADPTAKPEGPAPATPPAPASKSGATPPAEIVTPASKPPRVDGTYFGGTIGAGESFARVNNFETPNPMFGGTTSLRVGQAIYPWMTIGLNLTGTIARRFADPSQRLLQGALLVDFGFLPVPRIPLSLHVGFGAGGGAVREAGRTARSGFGGAVFTGAVRYEIFPLAARKRPRRGGGFSLGPELGWLGFTPAARGRPMSNTIYLGLFMGFYFGS